MAATHRWRICAVAWLLLGCLAVGAEPPAEDPPAGGAPVPWQPAPADGATPPATASDAGAATSVAGEASDMLRLTLADAIRMALEANLTLQSGALDVPIAHQSWLQADATFDRMLTAGIEVARDEQPTTSNFFGNQIRTTTVGGFVQSSRQLRDGSTVSLIFRADRLDTTQLFTDVNPSWTNSLIAEVRHPLLRNRGSVVQTDVRKAANDIAAAQANFEAQAEQILLSVAESYWELAYTQRNLESRRKSEAVAQQLLEDVKSRERAGVATPLETAQARAGLERRRSDRIESAGIRREISDQLLSLIRPFSVCEVTNTEIFALDDVMQSDDRVTPGGQRHFVQLAVRGRQELRALRADIASRGLDQVAARNSIQPQLDLVGRVGSVGLQRRVGDSLLDVFEGQNVTASLGVEFSVFLGQRAAKARWRAAGWRRRQAVLRMREQENAIVLEVRQALRSLRTAQHVMAASIAEVEAAQETLDGELLRLKEGKSTPFETLRLEDDLSLARTRVARAAADARRAEAKLWRAVGGLAKRHGGRVPRFPPCRTCR